MKAKFLIFVFMFVIAFAMASPFVSALFSPFISAASDANIATVQRTKPAKRGGDTVKTVVDTTQMDSLQLAIYKHNKAVDDSIRVDSIMKSKSNGIESPVTYSAEDSLVYNAKTRIAHLYGSAKMDYQNMKLNSDNVSMNLDSNLVRANGTSDSTAEGGIKGKPEFSLGGQEYSSDSMAFNFKSKKGMIKGVYTQQEEGYLTGAKAKRDSSGVVYIQHGRYTTCDKPHPDFYIALSRAKVRPGKDVVFGPAYLVVADVPLPLAIPYGFFPFSKKYSSGLIM
ncbi:MAG: putative LPS assembly protein LptD, partial [Prevotella intermedia]